MKRYLFYVCATALACAAMETPARAQASALGSSFLVYAAAARGSATAYDSKNHVYLVVSAYGAVTGRFVSADGAMMPNCASGAFFVLGGAAFGHFPRVAYSPDANGGLGGFIVTWHEADSPGGGNAVHARPVSLSSCLGPDRIVSGSDTTWWEAGPAISYSSASQRFLVAWRAIAAPGSPGNDIDGRLLDLSGQPIGASPIKITASGAYEDDPSIAYNPSTDQFLVAFRGADTSAFIAARTVAASSGAVGPQYELIRTVGTYITDTTFISSGNRYLVAWFQSPGGSTARFVNSAGVPEGPIIPLSVRFMANDALSLAYNALSDTSFMVSHDQFSYEDGGMEISAAGVPGPAFGATSIGGKGNFYPRIAASSIDKKWMLVTSNVFTAIYGQFIVTASGGGSPPPPPPPPSVAPLQITSFSANKSFPAAEGTAITWTATTTGGTNVQYQFWRYSATEGWQIAQPYSSANSFTWTAPAGTDAVQVWARSAGSSAQYEAFAATGYFDILVGARLKSFFPNRAFPIPLHVPVTFTATAVSAQGAVQYQFWRYSASTGWILAQDYSPSNTYTWYPLEGLNAVQVWVRTVGKSVAYEDYATSAMFTASAAAVITGLSANVPFPATPGTPITFTASATSGGGTIEYKFWGYNAAYNSWSPMRDWGVSNQMTWTPGAGDSGLYQVQVWVRDIGAALPYEDWRSTQLFSITNSTNLTLNVSRSLSGLRSGDSVTFMAQATGGSGNWEYAFWGYNGSSWVLLQPYTVNQNNFSWGVSPGTLAIQVWIRAPGSIAPYERWATTAMFVVSP
jgi:hypothetical protein